MTCCRFVRLSHIVLRCCSDYLKYVTFHEEMAPIHIIIDKLLQALFNCPLFIYSTGILGQSGEALHVVHQLYRRKMQVFEGDFLRYICIFIETFVVDVHIL